MLTSSVLDVDNYNVMLTSSGNVAAVREDRMPGGRNSGAVYNLYKVRWWEGRGERGGRGRWGGGTSGGRGWGGAQVAV